MLGRVTFYCHALGSFFIKSYIHGIGKSMSRFSFNLKNKEWSIKTVQELVYGKQGIDISQNCAAYIWHGGF